VPLPELPEVPELPELPLSMPLPLLPELPLLSLPCMELHADRPKASVSKPARSTLWCFCVMIHSF
jgi:hypothetical protein